MSVILSVCLPDVVLVTGLLISETDDDTVDTGTVLVGASAVPIVIYYFIINVLKLM